MLHIVLGKSTVLFMAHGYAGKIEESAKLGTKVSIIKIYNSGIWTLQ